MQIPKKINLLGEVYAIKVIPKETLKCDKCHDSYDGQCIFDDKTIELAADSSNAIDEILLHELGHYFGNYYDIDDSETFAQAFANFFKLIKSQVYDP